jgi:hypothetical protein
MHLQKSRMFAPDTERGLIEKSDTTNSGRIIQ